MKRRLFWLCTLGASSLALASTIVPHTLEQRARDADRVAVIKVLNQWTELEGDPSRPKLKTYTKVAVGEDVKGHGPRETTIVQIGGRSGAWELHVPGDASFVVGETALVFLRCAAPDRCYLVALGEGRLSIVENDVVYRDLFTNQWVRRPLAQVVSALRPPTSGPTSSSAAVAP